MDDNTTAYGLIADVLVGNLIMGSNLKISNESNTITLDESGITIKVPGEDGDGETVFSADSSGNVMLKGIIHAKNGTIGGLTISKSGIGVARKIEDGVTTFALAFSENGITTSSGLFRVTADGYLTAKDGTIGGFYIGEEALYNGTDSMTSTKKGVYLGIDGLNLGGGKFKVTNDGSVTITEGSINLGNGNFEVTSEGKVAIKDGEISLEDSASDNTINISKTGILVGSYTETNRVTEIINGKIHIHQDITSVGTSTTTIDHLGVYNTVGLTVRADANRSYTINDAQLHLSGASTVGGEFGSVARLSADQIRLQAINTDAGGWCEGTWHWGQSPSTASDKALKNSIESLDERYSIFFDALKPVRYKYNNGTSRRFHTGLIAQDVEKAVFDANLSDKDIAVVVKSRLDGKQRLELRYEELISICINEIQFLKKRLL